MHQFASHLRPKPFEGSVALFPQQSQPSWPSFEPDVDVIAESGGTRFNVRLPRVKAEDIELSFVGGVLTLKATRAVPDLDSSATLTGVYQRRFGLAHAVDRTRVSAAFTNGVLTIIAPVRRKQAAMGDVVSLAVAA